MKAVDGKEPDMNVRKPSRFLASVLILVMLCGRPLAQTPAPAPEPVPTADASQEAEQPKFIWGIIIKFVAGQLFSMFAEYLAGKITSSLTAGGNSNDGGVIQRLLSSKSGAIITSVEQATTDQANSGASGRNADPVSSGIGAKDATIVGEPKTPLKVDAGNANYQGVHVALLGADRTGNLTGFRPVTDGFKTGERIKLRVVSTFGGLLVIDNINPRGDQKQIYPPRKEDVVVLQAGEETLIPLGADQFFEFAGATGNEQLLVTVRDKRAFGSAASTAQVYRKDESYGSNFVQETTPGTYPVIAQGIRLRHD
jgi:hypothetical protein